MKKTSWGEDARIVLEKCLLEPLKILIWGPCRPNKNVSDDERMGYVVRVQMKKALRDKFPNADVFFSEDKQMKALAEGIAGQLNKEALQGQTANLVLILAISRGANLELDSFIDQSWFRKKAYIFLPEKYVDPEGLVKEIIKKLSKEQIVGYTDKEFNECKVATEKAVLIAHAEALRSANLK